MKTIEVVAAIICSEGRILATRRGYGDMAGGWEFPGGKIEAGESAEEALVREIAEELNATVEVGRLFCHIHHRYPQFLLDMRCYLCELEGEFTLLEHSDARWLDAANLRSVEWLPADIQIIDELEAQQIVR